MDENFCDNFWKGKVLKQERVDCILWVMLKFVPFTIARYGIMRRDMLILKYIHEITPLTTLFILTSTVKQLVTIAWSVLMKVSTLLRAF